MQSVGFIILFGVSVGNGIIMVSYFNPLRAEGMWLHDVLIEGAKLRLCPVLMTAPTTVLGLLPLLISRGIGAEIQRPQATMGVGGLFTAMWLTLLVLPIVYGTFMKKR